MGRSTTKKKASQRLTMGQRIVRWCFSPQRLIIAAVPATALLFWPVISRQLPDVESRPEYQVGLEQITVTPPPGWVPDNLVARVLRRMDLQNPLSLQDPTLSEQIAAAFVTYPWIEQVHRVTKSFPARVHVEVTYRRPVAFVEGIGGYYAIDQSTFLLPYYDFSPSDIGRYPIITNVTSVPQAGQAQSWGDPAVTGAAQLATLLMEADETGRTLWESWNLAAIETPTLTGLPDEHPDLEYSIRTQGGSLIQWGRSPASEHPGELSAAKKLQRLRDYHEDYNGFDDSPIANNIDVRGWRGIARSPVQDGTTRQ